MKALNFLFIILIATFCACGQKKEQSNFKKIEYLKTIINRPEFDPYVVNDYVIGEFYSPKTDSLIFYKLSLKSNNTAILSEIDDEICEILCKKKILLKEIDLFSVQEFLVDYQYVLEQKDAGDYDVFNVKKPFKITKVNYENIDNAVKLVFSSMKEFYSSMNSNLLYWKGKYHFSLENLERMGETHSVYFDFDISKTNHPKVISQLDNRAKKIRNCEVTHVTKDTLVLMDVKKNDDIFVLTKKGDNYNITGSPIYSLNPPNSNYPLTKE